MTRESLGVFGVAERLHNTLTSYIESAYHIRNTSLINERKRLLEEVGMIAQEPYVEATPSYEIGQSYDQLQIPPRAQEVLSELAKLEPPVGIYSRPYQHQAQALTEFLGKKRDIIVATGTGSGKTESFLMPILGTLAIESTERPECAAKPGCRALLLYPMNALVNDQLGRIRRMFGDERVAAILKEGRGRPVRFGSYTSRTPYPGDRDPQKDALHFTEMFEKFYLKYEKDREMVRLLRDKGRWPSKDLRGFYAKHLEEEAVYQSGSKKGTKFTKHHWDKRLRTQPEDRELLARHEMQQECPDILITNYSMLEYMLMRPIERPIFQQTKAWLHAHPDNQLILVLDEAHMYRGTGGAEVALLIRRLMARLGIDRSKLRCILTSASLGEGPEAEQAVIEFARELTGESDNGGRSFVLIRGIKESRPSPRPGTEDEALQLASFDITAFQRLETDFDTAARPVRELASRLGWGPVPDSKGALEDYLFHHLTGWGPSETLVQTISGKAVLLRQLAEILFPSSPVKVARRATEALLELGTRARRTADGRVFLPTRLHLLFRGVPGLYACSNPNCSERRDPDPSAEPILGRLYTTPRLNCTCTERARVFELLTHRDCGAAFLRAYARGDEEFLLHEPINQVGVDDETSERLQSVHLLVEGEPHPDALKDCAVAWLHLSTGRLATQEPADKTGFRKVYVPVAQGANVSREFRRCPICLRKWRGRSKIMDLTTKGEAPFANLVKAQLFLQPPQKEESLTFPNGGRKVLLFSDGRQKAARLARDIPREVEWDTFRQVLALAADSYKRIFAKDPRINDSLYCAFVSVVSKYNLQLFDGDDRKHLMSAVGEFRDPHDSDLHAALMDQWDPKPIPVAYYRGLLRQLCHPEFSLRAAAVGYVRPSMSHIIFRDIAAITNNIAENDAEALAVAFIDELLSDYAFETEQLISASTRQEAAGHRQDSWVHVGTLTDVHRRILTERFGLSTKHVDAIEAVLRKRLCSPSGNAYVIKGDAVSLRITPEGTWFQCPMCTYLSPVMLAGCCPNCGHTAPTPVDLSTSEYIQARKGFLRNPVVQAIRGVGRPTYVTAEEHTAQLSQRDVGEVFATTEKHELQFQDVLIDEGASPVDILSCTTTMEVGIDIGSLTAVGLRNVPPERENYQQRAGRAGRRGSAVSTVVTFAQGGPHDNHYFHHPQAIVAGSPRQPLIKTDNPRIAQRHVHAYLIQTFFHQTLDTVCAPPRTSGKSLFSALGSTSDFFRNDPDNPFTLEAFKDWVHRNILAKNAVLLERIVAWLPAGVSHHPEEWVRQVAINLLDQLRALSQRVRLSADLEPEELASGLPEGDSSDEESADGRDELLSFLFDQGLLPSYAFPTDLCSFLIEEKEPRKGGFKVRVKERPQQAINKALSEYAPGRLIVVNKVTYRSGGITSSRARVTDPDRAAPLFDGANRLRPYVACKRCTFVQDTETDSRQLSSCPVCNGPLDRGELLVPEVFHPEEGQPLSAIDKDQELTYATTAQFPVPLAEDDLVDWRQAGTHLQATHARDRVLVMVNKGNPDTNAGFAVCEKCGSASIFDPDRKLPSHHTRPYLVEPRKGRSVPAKCDGTFRQVYLGHWFRTDLLLLRATINPPLEDDIKISLTSSVIHDALRTICEALVLAASEHLDVDPSEFQAGFRMIRTEREDPLRTDIYLFDTLSGGAGYAEHAGDNLRDILESTLKRVENCPAQCDTSCTECLRHYQNQYWHYSLDRHLGAALLRYMLYGEQPKISPFNVQTVQLHSLTRLLELEGYKCSAGGDVPLRVEGAGHTVHVGTYPSLLREEYAQAVHPLTRAAKKNHHVCLVPDYLLTRNLPLVYNRVKNCLES
ncbi:DEAD/DEAH box helicase [Symbiobacterium terraclitae]|uniref:DEAD/DEAH box helicase n=1 Tax=Symbiobacterium terraclitae TaxID=557451 RepID=UPI0035B5280E